MKIEDIVKQVENFNWYQILAEVYVRNEIVFNSQAYQGEYPDYNLFRLMKYEQKHRSRPDINVWCVPTQLDIHSHEMTTVSIYGVPIVECRELDMDGYAYLHATQHLKCHFPQRIADKHRPGQPPLLVLGFALREDPQNWLESNQIICGCY